MEPEGPDESFRTRLIEGSPDCIKVLDLEGRLLTMNTGGMAVLEICDLTPFIGSSWIEFWQGGDREAARAAVEAARAGDVGRFVGFFPTTRTRKPMWFHVVVSAIVDQSGQVKKLLASSRDVTEWKRSDQLLHAIIDDTSTAIGAEYFHSLVQRLASGLGVRAAFVAEHLPNQRARSLAFWNDGAFRADFEYDLPSTPCLQVSCGQTCLYERSVQGLFPESRVLTEADAESYLGVPLLDSVQRIIGHIAVLDSQPLAVDTLALSVLKTFANRAGTELERTRAFEQLQRRHDESEERFRDLFDEAPIAYVNEGLDSKFIRANRTAMKVLGIQPEDVPHTYGKTFAPDTPDAQARMREAFESIGKGIDTSGVVLELRRKDNGEPTWIEWWSRPSPNGSYTRTMFVDITKRVLMEQEKARLEAQNSYLQEEIRREHNFGEIVGSDPTLLELLRQVEQVSRLESSVLILGETGTGKELIARAIHDRSPRRARALVKVNCGAISSGLVESELFGHVRGAFTGAIANRDGRFKLANGGTIFLDEVGELPLDTQVKLLRVLQEQEFEPLGSSTTIKVNVRVVAATNRDLAELVREGKFRADLYYRLNVVPLRAPALRDRAGDIPVLAMFFVQKLTQKLGKKIEQIGEETLNKLVSYTWPGNIRELQNVIERAVILSPGATLVLPEELRALAPPWGSNEVSEQSFEASGQMNPAPTAEEDLGSLQEAGRRHIESVLAAANWMIEGERGAARLLGVSPSTLRSRMQKLGVKRPEKSA